MSETSCPTLRSAAGHGGNVSLREGDSLRTVESSTRKGAPLGSSAAWKWIYAATAALSGIGLFGKLTLLQRIIPAPVPLLTALLALGLLAPLFWSVAIRRRMIVAPVTLGLLLVSVVFVFPRVEELHKTGRGTDQPDCVILVANHLMQGQWPYRRAEMWTRNPMSCGPGWSALQAPATRAFGYSGNMVILWSACLLVIISTVGWSDTAALLTLLCLSPAFWLAATNGTDFLTFGLAVTALLAALERAGRSAPRRFLLAVVAGVLAQFRMATLLLPAFLAEKLGRAYAFGAVLLALACEVGFIFWNAPAFIADGPLHIAFKATHLHLFSTHPLLASIEMSVPALLAAAVIITASTRIRDRVSIAMYFCAVFVIPSLLDLIGKSYAYASYTDVLQYWEGSLWLSGCLPLFAYLAVMAADRAPGTVSVDLVQTRPHLTARTIAQV